MTDIKIRDIRVFPELREAMGKMSAQSNPLLVSAEESLQGFLRDLTTDLKESQTQLEELKDGAREASRGDDPGKAAQAQKCGEEMSQMNQKIQELKSSIATIEHLLLRLDLMKRKMSDMTQTTQKAVGVLQQFEEIAMRYLKLSNLHKSNSPDSQTGSQFQSNAGNLRLVGDTYHFSKENSLSAMDIQRMENEIKSGGTKGNKLSIDGVNPLDFDMLKNNGFNVQQIGPNDYTAFKTFEK